MKKYLLITGLLGLLFSTLLYSQEGPIIKMEIEKESEKNLSERAKSNHILKLNPIIFARGDVPIYYENNFRSNLSVEAGIGFTVKDYLRNSFFSDSSYGIYDYAIEEEIEIGYSFRVGLRYYAANYGFEPEGLYFALNYRQQNYSSTLTSVREITAQNEELKSKNSDVFLSVGYVFMLDENAFLDPYVGFGFRARNYQDISINQASYNISNKSDVVPLIVFGLKFAISL